MSFFSQLIDLLQPEKPFDPEWDARKRGTWGEGIIAHRLWKDGYRILERRWVSREKSDIDLIAAAEDHLLFVEVKVRSNPELEDLWYDIYDDRRQRLLRAAAADYLHATRQTTVDIRFNAYIIRPARDGAYEVLSSIDYIDPATVPGWKGDREWQDFESRK